MTPVLLLPRRVFLDLIARDCARWQFAWCGDLAVERQRDVNTASLLIEGQPYTGGAP